MCLDKCMIDFDILAKPIGIKHFLRLSRSGQKTKMFRIIILKKPRKKNAKNWPKLSKWWVS